MQIRKRRFHGHKTLKTHELSLILITKQQQVASCEPPISKARRMVTGPTPNASNMLSSRRPVTDLTWSSLPNFYKPHLLSFYNPQRQFHVLICLAFYKLKKLLETFYLPTLYLK